MNKQINFDPYLPMEVQVVKCEKESVNVFTLHLKFTNPDDAANYHVKPGQFNMLYAYGIGEVPISVVSDLDNTCILAHTIRELGDATRVLSSLKEGDYLGLRGPFGNGWPLHRIQNKTVMVITGGIGSAPIITAINELIKYPDLYKKIYILHGINQPKDLLFPDLYEEWGTVSHAEVYLSCIESTENKSYHQGLVTELLDKIDLQDPCNTACIMCGPNKMMTKVSSQLLAMNIPAEMIFLSLERNMQCGLGHCGHCQCGPWFVCKDGPVFPLTEIQEYMQAGL